MKVYAVLNKDSVKLGKNLDYICANLINYTNTFNSLSDAKKELKSKVSGFGIYELSLNLVSSNKLKYSKYTARRYGELDYVCHPSIEGIIEEYTLKKLASTIAYYYYRNEFVLYGYRNRKWEKCPDSLQDEFKKELNVEFTFQENK